MRVAMFPRQHTLSVVDGGDAVEIVVAPIFKEPTDQHVALQRFGVLGEIGHRVAGARQGLTKLADNRLHRSIEEPLSCRRAIAERTIGGNSCRLGGLLRFSGNSGHARVELFIVDQLPDRPRPAECLRRSEWSPRTGDGRYG